MIRDYQSKWIAVATLTLCLSPAARAQQDPKKLAATALEEAQARKNKIQDSLRSDLDILRRARASRKKAAQQMTQRAVLKDQESLREAQTQEQRALAWMAALDKAGGSSAVLLVHSKGTVKVVRKNQTLSPSRGYALQEGDEIRTGHSGIVELRFPDGTSATLGPDGGFSIRQIDSAPDRPLRLHLLKGLLHWELPEKHRTPQEVTTETAVVSVRGTQLDVAVEKNGLTDVRPYQGTAQVSGRPENLPRFRIQPWWTDLYR